MKNQVEIGDNVISISTPSFHMIIRFPGNINGAPLDVSLPHKPAKKPLDEYDTMHAEIYAKQAEVAVGKKTGGKNKYVTPSKACPVCGKEFHPRSNAQVYCSADCGMKPKKKLTSEQESDLDSTLAEIEHNRKKPYEFGK